ncbi:MAG: DUF1835 domain-containing protein [Clostridiales bacterium]|nr:DUF1835 domain-containing protein [Clostridiales bacterium]
MLNVCFSEEVKNTLQCAIQDGYLINSDTVCIPDDLSFGDISNIKKMETRIPITKLLGEMDHLTELNAQLDYREFFQKLYIHDKVVIWYSNTAAEYCGYLYVLWLLNDSPVEVQTVCCSRTLKRGENRFRTYASTKDIAPEEFIRFLPYLTTLSKTDLQSQARVWEKLMQENGDLRIWQDYAIRTEKNNFYDGVIQKYITAQKRTIENVMSDLQYKEQIVLTGGFMVSRIREMASQGMISYLENPENAYLDLVSLR